MARQVTPQSLEQHIASGRLDPVYVLTGPDGAMKAKLVAQLVETIEEDLRPFNVDKLFPPDQREEARKQFWTVLQLARTLPMMAPRRVIVVAQAEKLMQVFKAGDDEATGPADDARAGRKGRKAVQKAAGEAELEAFEEFLSNPTPDAVVVFVAGEGLNRSLKPVKLLERLATLVDCDPLPQAGDAIEWVKAEAAGEGVRIEPSAARLLATLAGGDIARLRAEFERAVLFASGDGIITEAAVREIASAATTQNAWAMTNAIERGSTGEALRELALKIDAGEYPPMILGQVRWFVANRLEPRRVRTAMDALFRTDLALKTSGGDPRVLLERLVVELCG
ncbi:MAG: DNA polymerase III subunit delta [Vicinamibacterales bacterium]|nr:DNA polymerase III subunit delta [Vicinamibacterales bacterium]